MLKVIWKWCCLVVWAIYYFSNGSYCVWNDTPSAWQSEFQTKPGICEECYGQSIPNSTITVVWWYHWLHRTWQNFGPWSAPEKSGPHHPWAAVYRRPKVFGRSRRFLTFGFDFGCRRSMQFKAEGLAEGWNFLKFNKSNYKFCDKKFKMTRVYVFPITTVTKVFTFQKG